MKRTYKVNGMTCGHCANSVKAALEHLSVNAAAEVNLAEGTVSIEGDLPVDAIKGAIAGAGYELEGEM